MSKENNKSRSSIKKRVRRLIVHIIISATIFASLSIIFVISYLIVLDHMYKGKIYPYVFIESTDVSGKTPDEIAKLWETKNFPYRNAQFELKLQGEIATVSGTDLHLGYDSTLLAQQAYLIGRSGKILSDIYTKLFQRQIILTPYFRWDKSSVNDILENLADTVNVAPQDALFEFKNGRVTTFKPAQRGVRLNREQAVLQLETLFPQIPYSSQRIFSISLVAEPIDPTVTTGQANNFGIKERIGHGYSEFTGSIPGRIKNVELAAAKLHGVLIAPGEVISYNKLMGDISAATGWAAAYIIKDGRTVLGDGGGVCQGSTTLFRAAMDAGLPILERQAHAYRVHYYEEAGYKPGIDATVFAPSVDLRIKNDTPSYILIQSTIDTKNLTLAIDIYGTSDGRKGEILNHQILSETPPPPSLYQDDPTLPAGVVKQVDWSAWGAKTVFTYRVTRGSETLIDQQITSNFRPWQAVYLKGTK